jgi:hypothetical protein
MIIQSANQGGKMVKQIAQQLFDWIKEIGATGGDAYDQERLDEVDDFLRGQVLCPVPLSLEELDFAIANSDAISEEVGLLMDKEVCLQQGWWYDEAGNLHLCNGPQLVV